MQQNTRKVKERNEGITLIALVVTIIVLIILAGIAVNLLLGENGLLQRAKDSKTVYDKSSLAEKMSLLLMDYKIERETTGKTLQEYLTKKNIEYEVDGENVKIEEDGYIVTINAITLEMEEPIKATKTAKITLNKNVVEPEEAFTATLTLGEDVDITKCKYKLEKASVTVEKQDVTTGVASTSINLTAPNEKGEYYLYLLVGYKNSDETLLKRAKVIVNVEITGVSLNKTSSNLFVGEEDNLTATVLPIEKVEQGITWSTSNSNIATVDQTGKVTAVNGGTAQITATSNEDISKSATCTVTVEKLSSIAVTIAPTKTQYYSRDTLDLTGMVVTATYESGSTKILSSNEYTTTPLNGNEIQRDTTQVNINYGEGSISKNTTIEIQNLGIQIFNGTSTDTEITGGFDVGFTVSNIYNWSNYKGVDYAIGKVGFYVCACNSGNYGIAVSKNKINVNELSLIKYIVSGFTNHNSLNCDVFVGIAQNNNMDTNFVRQDKIEGVKTFNDEEFDVDVSDLTGEYYLKFITYHPTNVSDCGSYGCLQSITAN